MTAAYAATALSLGMSTAQGRRGTRSAKLIDGLDAYCERALEDWKVPGLALAVVRHGELLLARGYGVRELGKDSPVDENTVFSVASCTKSFVAAALGRLVDERRLHWDDAIVRHVPALLLPRGFRGPGPSVRNALQHRSGLPAANMLWRSGAFGAEEILRRVHCLQPVAEPGKKFLYNNVMYLAAGKAAEHIAGRSWQDLVTTEFFEPLAMRSSVPDSTTLAQVENLAAPHAETDGRVEVIDRYCPDVIAPAGAIHSTAKDMAQWLLLHLARGRFGGHQLLAAACVDEMHTPAEPLNDARPVNDVPKAPIDRYGLGWFVNWHAGKKAVEHTGTMNGFVAWMAMIPEEQLGVVILSNSHQTGINSALRSWIFDRILDRPDHDWSRAILKDYKQGWQKLLREAKAEFDATRPQRRPLSVPATAYVGQYESPLYGTITLIEADGQLTLRFGTRFQGRLQAWQGDDFRVFFPNPRLDDWLVTFSVADGKVKALKVQEAPWAPQWYEDRDDLGSFVKR